MTPRRRTTETTARLRATLVEHARRIVSRDGPDALTMRALAAEADCALGLPYKVFADRHELVTEILRGELDRLATAGADLVGRAGRGQVTDNLVWYGELILDSPAVALSAEVMADESLARQFLQDVDASGTGPADFQSVFAGYLAAEQEQGRVHIEVEVEAVAFLLAGALHNLVVSGPAYPRPSRPLLRRHLAAVARLLEPG